VSCITDEAATQLTASISERPGTASPEDYERPQLQRLLSDRESHADKIIRLPRHPMAIINVGPLFVSGSVRANSVYYGLVNLPVPQAFVVFVNTCCTV
jgi:hypothetical protein